MPKKTSKNKVTLEQAVKAFGIDLENMIKDYEEFRDVRVKNNKQEKAYNAGVWNGLVLAHCLSAIIDFKDQNSKRILKTLEK